MQLEFNHYGRADNPVHRKSGWILHVPKGAAYWKLTRILPSHDLE